MFRGSNDLYYFHLRAANGEIVLASEGYTTLRGCENGVRSVQQNSPLDERYIQETAENGQFYFKLLAGNRKVIGVSEMYTTRKNRDKGITAVQQSSTAAIIQKILDA
ncbi:MAG: YegP family protein [Ardenticatenaceae bacterium]|nr:YegP family protein [Ardenticatenaceae bacterium]